jgi:hypothetical protein
MRNTLVNTAVLLVSLLVAFAGAEIGLRLIGHGTIYEWTNFVEDEGQWHGRWRTMQPHPVLGYIPRDGYAGTDHGYQRHMTFGRDGIRLHHIGRPPKAPTPPILVVGDSFAMGAEVDDDESWAAYLETTFDRRVLAAGVPGYGFDQVVLRAEMLVETYRPDTLLVGFIADDVERTRMRVLWGLQKPYFDVVDGALVLRNVPLAAPDPDPHVDLPRQVLGYSYLLDVALRRMGLGMWWRRGTPAEIRPAHDRGREVTCLLMGRLAALRDRHRLRLVMVAQYSIQAWETDAFHDSERRIARDAIDCARRQGIETIDTHDAVAAAVKARGLAGYYTGTHMNADGNRLTADLIAGWLKMHP